MMVNVIKSGLFVYLLFSTAVPSIGGSLVEKPTHRAIRRCKSEKGLLKIPSRQLTVDEYLLIPEMRGKVVSMVGYEGTFAKTFRDDVRTLYNSVSATVLGLSAYFSGEEKWDHVRRLVLDVQAVLNEKVRDDDDFFFKLALKWIPNNDTTPKQATICEHLLSSLINIEPSLVSSINENGETLLHIAARLNLTYLIPYLRENDADVNSLDWNGRTPLLAACDAKQYEAVTILCRYDAKLDLQNDSGVSPLHLAKLNESIKAAIEKGTGIELIFEEEQAPVDEEPAPSVDRAGFIRAQSCPNQLTRYQSLPEFPISSPKQSALRDSGVLSNCKQVQRQKSFSGSTLDSIT